MGWAQGHIEKLQRGETVRLRPFGGSMTPHIKSGALVTVEPATVETVAVDDVVLCIVAGAEYLHFVRAVERTANPRVKIGNAKGGINGWTAKVYGKVTKIE